MCYCFAVVSSHLKDKFKPAAYFICDVCEPRKLSMSTLNDRAPYVPLIKRFGLSQEDQTILLEIQNLGTSSLFWDKFWNPRGQGYEYDVDSESPFKDATDKIWKPCKAEWDKLCEDMKSGRVTIAEFEEIFCGVAKNCIEGELKLMKLTLKEIEERMEQIDLLNKVSEATAGAEVILKAKERFGLSGDFSDLETLINMVDIIY